MCQGDLSGKPKHKNPGADSDHKPPPITSLLVEAGLVHLINLMKIL